MCELTGALPFSDADTDSQNYTLSLLRLCSLHKCIPAQRLSEIRSGLEEAFLETAAQFTMRASSSLPKKQAALLYSSVLFQADVFLRGLESPQRAVDALRTMPVAELRKAGQNLILEIHRENVRIFKSAYALRLNFPLFGYRYVMDAAFDEYFRLYSARFDARNCIAAIDYPLLGVAAYAIEDKGALFIRAYYTGILHENEFCARFPEHETEAFLHAYGRLYGCAYTDLVFNIAEVLLNNLLVCGMLEKSLFTLYPTGAELRRLQQQFVRMPEQSIRAAAAEAFLRYQALIPAPGCYAYLCRYLPAFAQDLYARIQNGGLGGFVICAD
ncbi:MAG: DUF6179 domain-containing protein [Oscillospiraceae bacterium]